MSEWRVIIDTDRPTRQQMPCDETLAQEGLPSVRLFTWNVPAISLGWKQPVPEWVGSRRTALEWVERPTGGGIAFHGSDLSVAVVLPRRAGEALSSVMCAIGRSAVELCRSYGVEAMLSLDEQAHERVTYCLTQATSYAVMIGRNKVAGFALRRYPESWLVQGSLLVQPLPHALVNAIPNDVVDQLHAQAISLSEASGIELAPVDVAHRWAAQWSTWYGRTRSREACEVEASHAM